MLRKVPDLMAEYYHIFQHLWQWVVIIAHIVVVALAFGHLLLLQKDSRAAAFWAVIIIFVPLLGGVFYALFGINSLRRRGKEYKAGTEHDKSKLNRTAEIHQWEALPDLYELRGLALTLNRISRLDFCIGNKVKLLRNGEEAMPAMLEAIRCAEKSVTLCSYIFEAKGVGEDFVDELVRAKARGVEVRVMVDDAGTKYSFPPVTRILRSQGVNAQRYMPLRFFLRILTMNLRNHRKIMVVDGHIGFTGGMNIRQGNMLNANPSHPVQDLHFQVEGPVVQQLQRVFAEDWAFCANEMLQGETWFPKIEPVGEVAAIGIPDGPDEDMELMPKAIYAAINAAQSEIKIMTPYFLPDEGLIWSLTLAAQRGVQVTVITPRKNNIPFVRWAARTLYAGLIEKGVRVCEAEGHFDHSKFMTVDGFWSLIGSTNWDPRSLRLNFEFNLGCFDRGLASELNVVFAKKLALSNEVTLEQLAAATIPERLRDGVARLFIPIL